MKLLATPLLESGAEAFVVDDLQPRKFVDLLDQHKALLFQSHAQEQPISTDDFGDLLASLQLEYYPYIGGAAPRTVIPVKAGKDIIFTANERCVKITLYLFVSSYSFCCRALFSHCFVCMISVLRINRFPFITS
jgi:hypothetical protein